jgi:hypothetical protein
MNNKKNFIFSSFTHYRYPEGFVLLPQKVLAHKDTKGTKEHKEIFLFSELLFFFQLDY